MDKNSREKDMLYQWAVSNSTSYCFQEIDKTKDSYYMQRMNDSDSSQYIREYAVESLPELMKEIDTLWGADEVMCQIKKAIGVAALKNKPNKPVIREETSTEHKTESMDKLPVFIYNF